MKKLFPLFLLVLFIACDPPDEPNLKEYEAQINKNLDSWNEAASKADFKTYFDFLTEDAVFIGTDAKENWVKKDFAVWAKPYFDKKKTWHFKALERHIHFDTTGNLAWFDELLSTQMKICRGSGVLVRNPNNQWKLKQYVLSITMPNDSIAGAVRIKSPIEDSLIRKLEKK